MLSAVRFATPFGCRGWSSLVQKISPLDPNAPYIGRLQNCVNGSWQDVKKYIDVPDPMNGNKMLEMPYTQNEELEPFVESLNKIPKHGLHNPLKNPERYLMYGRVCHKAAALLHEEEVADYFTRTIQRTMPKSYAQARGEVNIVKQFLQNFSGDQTRYLARGFTNPGDHLGQQSQGYRWPYGPVAVVSPFNFPLEIPALQLVGSVLMGNKTLIKADWRTSYVVEAFVRFLQHCGMPTTDVDLVHCKGPNMEKILTKSNVRMLQFTGSTGVAERLSTVLNGRVKLEDAGFDWKILGPDVHDVDYAAWQSDQDAYAISGQKCSAQSILFMHKNWSATDFEKKIVQLAKRRSLNDLTLSPVLSMTTEQFVNHANKMLKIPGSRLIMGAKELKNHTIPKCYAAVEPTAIFVPLEEILKPENFSFVCEEVFAPFQVVTEYDDNSLDKVLECCERMSHHLTAAVVSRDPQFINHVLGHTVNGTTYAGQRARTTGAPQNHWFGPCGDPRAAGIGTIESIQYVWSGHREIIHDDGPVPKNWTTPKAT